MSETVKAENFKYGMQIDHRIVNKNAKLGQREPWRGHVTYF